MSQSELAERSGVAIRVIQSLEQGQRGNPSVDTLRRLARALGTTIDELVA